MAELMGKHYNKSSVFSKPQKLLECTEITVILTDAIDSIYNIKYALKYKLRNCLHNII